MFFPPQQSAEEVYEKAIVIIAEPFLRRSKSHPGQPKTLEDQILQPYARDGINFFKDTGVPLFMISFMPPTPALQAIQMLESVNSSLDYPFEGFYICQHDASERCICRRPSAFLLSEIRKKFSIKQLLLVGASDADRDMALAAHAEYINGHEIFKFNKKLIPLEESVTI